MNTRRNIITAAMALGLLAGSAGIASAVTTGQTATPNTDPAASGTTEADDSQEPSLNGSIQAPDDESVSEADEATNLAGLATISDADATRAALDANPGATANGASLENENGSVVYEVSLTDASGAAIDVKVDAGTGAVLGQDSGDDEGNETNESGEENEADETDGIDHQNEGEETGENGNGVADADDANETPEAVATN